jgi:hypothetical protein
MNKPSQDVMRLPIEQRAEIAFKAAVARAIDEHARLGVPIYSWHNKKVVKLSPRAVLSRSQSRRRK